MPNYRIVLYPDEKGYRQAEELIKLLQPKVSAKFIKTFKLLSDEGPNLKRPHADYLKEGIRELRVKFSPNEYRALYFFTGINKIVITHIFVKKTDHIPEEEINKAIKIRSHFEERVKKGEIIE